MQATEPRQVAAMYRETAERITELLASAHSSAWENPVDACPGWTVRDVLSHTISVGQDWASGMLSGPPTDEQSAEHVRRFAGQAPRDLLGVWAAATSRLVHLADAEGLQPPLGDIACHEHDIRSALGKPGARDAQSVLWTSDRLLAMLRPPVPLRITVEDGEYRSGPPDGDEIVLLTTRFDALRWRTGRRSRAQLAAMDWSTDPAPVLDHLYLFGPATSEVIE